jgi:hypothetical protein
MGRGVAGAQGDHPDHEVTRFETQVGQKAIARNPGPASSVLTRCYQALQLLVTYPARKSGRAGCFVKG